MLTDTFIESVFSAARALLREGCADAISIYTVKSFGERQWSLHSRIGIQAEPACMTEDIALKLGRCFDMECCPVFSTRKSHILRALYFDLNRLHIPDTPRIEDMRRKMAGETTEENKEDEDEKDIASIPDEILDAKGPDFDVARFSRGEAGPEELIVSRSVEDIFILSLCDDGIDIRSVLTKPADTSDSRVSLSLPLDISTMPREERIRVVRNWLRGYLPDEPLLTGLSEYYEVSVPDDDTSLFYWVKEFGHCFPGQIRIRDPLESYDTYNDALCEEDSFSESSRLETMVGKSVAELIEQRDFPTSVFFPGQGTGFPATYAGGRIFFQGGPLQDEHYVMPVHSERRAELIGKFFILRLARLMGIPAVESVWFGQDRHEALILRRFDVRNGRVVWRESAAQAGKAGKDVLSAEDVRLLYRRSILGRIAGFAWRNFDLVELKPTAYPMTMEKFADRLKAPRGNGRSDMRLAPFVGAAPENSRAQMEEMVRQLIQHRHDPVAEELGIPAPEAVDIRAQQMRAPVDALAITLVSEFPCLREEVNALARDMGNAFANSM